MPASLALPKFIGTTTLGLLTGLTLSTQTTYPTLLLLPSATHCARTFSSLSGTLQTLGLSLSALSAFSFAGAYAISPRNARHPYLLWAAALTCLASGAEAVRFVRGVLLGGDGRAVVNGRKEEEKSGKEAEVIEEDEDGWVVEEKGVNGEEVERRVRRAVRQDAVRSAVLGAAFGVAVIGLWGDGA